MGRKLSMRSAVTLKSPSKGSQALGQAHVHAACQGCRRRRRHPPGTEPAYASSARLSPVCTPARSGSLLGQRISVKSLASLHGHLAVGRTNAPSPTHPTKKVKSLTPPPPCCMQHSMMWCEGGLAWAASGPAPSNRCSSISMQCALHAQAASPWPTHIALSVSKFTRLWPNCVGYDKRRSPIHGTVSCC